MDEKNNEEQKLTLAEQIKNINDKLEKALPDKKTNIKTKPFKLKYSVRSQSKTAAKKNKVIVFKLQKNRTAIAEVCQIKDGFIMVNDIPRKCEEFYIYLWEGKTPCLFLPEWDIEPIGTEAFTKKYPDGIPLSDKEKWLIGVMKSNEVMAKKNGNFLMWILIAVGAIAAIFMLFGGAKK